MIRKRRQLPTTLSSPFVESNLAGRPMCMNDGLANRKPRCHSADEKDTPQVNFGPVFFSFRTSLANTTMLLRLFGSAERRAYLALLTL